MGLAGSGHRLVLAELLALRYALDATNSTEHCEVVAEEAFGGVTPKLGQEVEYASMIAGEHLGDHIAVGFGGFRRRQVKIRIGRFVVSELTKRPELVAQTTARQDDDAAIKRGDGGGEQLAKEQKVVLVDQTSDVRLTLPRY